MPLMSDGLISQEAMCGGQERDFIQEARRPRRWWTHVLKSHLKLGLISNFFYINEGGAGRVEVRG